MATETATAPPPVVETEKSVVPSVSPAKTRDGITTPRKSTKTASTPTSATSASGTVATAPILVSSVDKPVDSPSPKRNELPKIVVKKEPTSPEPPSRHRPPKLHLSNDPEPAGSAVPRTAGGSLSTMRDVGMACLSPGFATHDPTMREQLQRSISVRDQQRSIIEARLQRHAKPGGGKDNPNEPASARAGSSHTPKRRPPNSLTIVPPPHRAFANERVVQSAPLNQSFTGRHHPSTFHPPPQHTHNPHNVNRLPPISDVFASERLDSGARTSRLVDPPQSGRHYYPAPRPSQPSPNNITFASRSREHRSAEEALQLMSGGREDLLPRIIHYGGHQPPTPPSPPQAATQHTPSKLNVHGEYHPPQSAGRRRNRAEYERDNDFGPGSRDSPETKRQKKEEFLSLCARAWELFHS